MKKDIKNLNKFTSDFIVSSRGQLDYPGMNTLIPNANGRITMKGVKQNVLGIDDLGNKKIMKPKGEYQFPGDSVYEIPLKKKGGEFKKGLVSNPKKTKKGLASKKYSKSLSATNVLFTENSLFKKPKSRKNKVYNPNAKYYAEGGDTGCPNGQVWSKKDKKCIDLPVFGNSLNNGTFTKLTNLSDGLDIKPLNSFSDFGKIKPKKIPVIEDSFLETLEKDINDFLDNPLKKAAQVSESLKEKGEDPSDALRHSTAGALTAQTIANKTGNIPFISNPLGYLGANIAGIGHELSTLSQAYLDDRPWSVKLQESLEDIYNNSAGANTIFNNNSEKDKINYLLELTRTNQLPDGYGEERPFRDNPKWTDPYNQKQYGGIHKFVESGKPCPEGYIRYNGQCVEWQEPEVIETDENTGYNAATGEISQDTRPGSIENNDWWKEHEDYHHLQNLAGGMSTAGFLGQRPNNTVASDQAKGDYYDRRDTELEAQTDAMIKADPNLQFIPRNILQGRSITGKYYGEGGDGFVNANDLMYQDPSTVEGEARVREEQFEEDGKSIFPKKQDGGITKFDDGGTVYTVKGSKGYYKKVNGQWQVDWNKSGKYQPLSKGDVKARTAVLNKMAKPAYDKDYDEMVAYKNLSTKDKINKFEPKKEATKEELKKVSERLGRDYKPEDTKLQSVDMVYPEKYLIGPGGGAIGIARNAAGLGIKGLNKAMSYIPAPVSGGLNAYFGYHGLKEFGNEDSHTRKSMSRAYDNPTWSNIGDAAWDVGINSLNFLGLPFGKAFKGTKNVIKGFKGVPKQLPGSPNVVSSVDDVQKAGFLNPLALIDRVTPRPPMIGTSFPLGVLWDDPVNYSPFNLIPGYGRKLAEPGFTKGMMSTNNEITAYRKFGNSLDDLINSKSFKPEGGFRMGAKKIQNEGNWAEPGIANEHYKGVFAAGMNPRVEGTNIQLQYWPKRYGVVGMTKEGNPAIPITDPGLSFHRRLPFSNRYVSIDKQKLIDNKFQLATQLPHVQSLIEKYGIAAAYALTFGYLANGKEGAIENLKTLNKYSIDPIKNWSKTAWDELENTLNEKQYGGVHKFDDGGSTDCPKGKYWDGEKCTKLITYGTDQKLIDGVSNWAMHSANPDKISSAYNDQIKHYLYTGKYGYDPVNMSLIKLNTINKKLISKPDQETKKILAKQDDKAAYTQSIIDAGFDPETFGKSKGTNVITGEEIYGDKSQEDIDKINKEAINNFVTEGHKKAILESPFNIAANFTPMGMAAGVMQGAANLLPDAYNFAKDPSWSGAGAVGMDALMMAPAAKGLSELGKQVIKRGANYGNDIIQTSKQAGKFQFPKYKNVYRAEHAGYNQAAKEGSVDGRWVANNPNEVSFYVDKLKDPATGNVLPYSFGNQPVRIIQQRLPEYEIKNTFGAGMPEEARIMSMGRGEFTNEGLDDLLGFGTGSRFSRQQFNQHDINAMSTAPFLYNKNEGLLDANLINKLRNQEGSNFFSSGKNNVFNNQKDALDYLKLEQKLIDNNNMFKKYLPFKEGGTNNNYVELDLTPEEIQKYIDGGYIVEEIN